MTSPDVAASIAAKTASLFASRPPSGPAAETPASADATRAAAEAGLAPRWLSGESFDDLTADARRLAAELDTARASVPDTGQGGTRCSDVPVPVPAEWTIRNYYRGSGRTSAASSTAEKTAQALGLQRRAG